MWNTANFVQAHIKGELHMKTEFYKDASVAEAFCYNGAHAQKHYSVYIKALNDPVLVKGALCSHVSPYMVKSFMPFIREDAKSYPTLSASTMDIFAFFDEEMCDAAYVPGTQPIEDVLDKVLQNFAAAEGMAGALVFNSSGYFAIA